MQIFPLESWLRAEEFLFASVLVLLWQGQSLGMSTSLHVVIIVFSHFKWPGQPDSLHSHMLEGQTKKAN